MANSDISIGFQAQGATDLARQFSAIRKQIQSVEAPLVGATNKFKAFEKASLTTGGAFRNIRAPIQNAAFQVQDIAVQLSMGTNAALVLAQQLPQLASGFGAIGAVIGGVVAVGAGIIMAFQKTADKAVTAEEKLDSLKSTVTELSGAFDAAKLTTSALEEKYGSFASQVRTINVALLELKKAAVVDILRKEITGLSAVTRGTSTSLDAAEDSIFSFLNTGKKLEDVASLSRIAPSQFITAQLKSVKKELKLAGDDADNQAKIMLEKFTQLDVAAKQGMDEETISGILDNITDSAKELGIPLENLPASIRNVKEVLAELAKAEIEADVVLQGKRNSVIRAFEDQAEAIRRARDPLYAYQQDLKDLGELSRYLAEEDVQLLREELTKTFLEAARKLTPLQEEVEKLSQNIAEGLGKSLAGVVTGSETAEQAMKKFVARAIQDLIKLALKIDEVNQKQAGLGRGDGTGGNIIARIFSGITRLVGSSSGNMTDDDAMIGFSGERAKGGPVMGGKTYLVGEKGPELFTAPKSGQIVPNNQLGGGDTVVNQTFQISTGVAQTVRAELVSLLPSIKEQTVAAVANQKTRGGARGSRL